LDNPQNESSAACRESVDFIIILGLALSNGLIKQRLIGSLLAPISGPFADVQMGHRHG